MIFGDEDVGVRFIVTEEDIEFGFESFDEVGFE